MALYDYKCPKCHVIYPIEHSVHDDLQVSCVLCKVPMRKVYSAPAVTFNGSGWGHQ